MQPKGVTKLVIDLRGNTGGYFPGGVDVARLLLPDKTDISFVNDYKGAELSYSTYSDGMAARSNGRAPSKRPLGSAPARQRPSSAPAPPQDAPGGSGWLDALPSQGEPEPPSAQPDRRVLGAAGSEAADSHRRLWPSPSRHGHVHAALRACRCQDGVCLRDPRLGSAGES